MNLESFCLIGIFRVEWSFVGGLYADIDCMGGINGRDGMQSLMKVAIIRLIVMLGWGTLYGGLL